MKAAFAFAFAGVVSAAQPTTHSAADLVRVLGPQGINLWQLNRAAALRELHELPQENLGQEPLSAHLNPYKEFPSQWFRQPLDHFNNETGDTFLQRYWVNTRHYKPGRGAPVIVLDGGETSGEDRLQFLDTGIVDILARSTGGVGVVLEHRYYGKSQPVANLTTDSLRFLNNAQAAADSANFMANIKFKGIDEDLTAPNTPWIYYGGSYAGARAAHMKILYPDLVYGAIASSGVTHAALSNWEYMDIIGRAADQQCMLHLVKSIETIDAILNLGRLSGPLKRLFGLNGLAHDEDFVSVIESPLGSWQSKNWNPEIGSTTFDEFCTALNKPPLSRRGTNDLPYGHEARLVTLPDDLVVDWAIINYGKYIREHYVSQCPSDKTVEECFGTFDDEQYQGTDLSEDWRLWLFQVCTEWGYFTTAPPDQNIPRIISRRLTLEYESKICPQAFPPGKYFKIPKMPNITVVNELGDFDIAADRLAIIDGEVDPWRPDTPHSFNARPREDTSLRPFKLIPGGVHHYDEYGLADIFQEPPQILQIHSEMIIFVQQWLEDWPEVKAKRNH
ncbi:hypothetical protein HGRIS_000775 [Hohenbuehelia grisea]|uniref:Peptidase S28 n=1 Tax=Hohenbuehelia grisea TaxID=104357 RepID=A0ABR3IPP9_9AGAR